MTASSAIIVVLELFFFHFILLFDCWILRQKKIIFYTYSLDINCGSPGHEIFFVCDFVSLYTYQIESMLIFYFKNRDYFCFSFQNPEIFFTTFSLFLLWSYNSDDFLLQFLLTFLHLFWKINPQKIMIIDLKLFTKNKKTYKTGCVPYRLSRQKLVKTT